MHALIDPRRDRVCQICDATFPVAPPLEWVECPKDVTTQHTYRDGKFEPPPPKPEPDDNETTLESRVEELEARIKRLEKSK